LEQTVYGRRHGRTHGRSLPAGSHRQLISCTLTMKYWKVPPLASTNW
jgi:hypothetical protein